MNDSRISRQADLSAGQTLAQPISLVAWHMRAQCTKEHGQQHKEAPCLHPIVIVSTPDLLPDRLLTRATPDDLTHPLGWPTYLASLLSSSLSLRCDIPP